MSWEGARVAPWGWIVGLLLEDETAEGPKDACCWLNDDEKKVNGGGVVVEAVGWDCSEKEGGAEEEDWVR